MRCFSELLVVCGLWCCIFCYPAAAAKKLSPCPKGCSCVAGRGECRSEMSCQRLSDFPAAEDYPPDLDCLFLSSPKLSNLTANAKQAGLRAFPSSLRRLDLSTCGLGELPEDDSLGRLTQLRVLNLEFNRLQRLPKSALHGLKHLKVLWLTGNHYSPDEREYKKMKALGNRLSKLDEEQFKGLENLQVLLLHHNRLKTLPEKILQDQKKLKVLKLLDNPFQPPLSRSHSAFTELLSGASPALYQLDIEHDSGDDLEDYWEESETYLSDAYFKGPPKRRKKGKRRSEDL